MASEREAVTGDHGLGNAAAMREALVYADRVLRKATEDNRYGDDVVYLVGCMRTVAAACRAALSAPPRNCDRFNTGNPMKDAEDAYSAWQRYCDDPTIPPSCKVESAFRQWLFATAKPETEGGNDGSK